MAGFSSDNIGLLFKIQAQDDASEVIGKLLKNITSGSQDIKGAASEAIENYSAKVSALGVELGTVTGGAAIAITTLFEIGTTALKVGEYLFDLAKTSAEFSSSIYDATVQTGLSATAVSALGLAAEQSDVSLQGVIGGLSLFEKKLGSAKEGSQSAIEVMQRLFGADWKTQTVDAEAALETIFNRINNLKDPTEKIKAATDFAGRSGVQWLKIIDQTGGSFVEFKKRAEEAGLTLSEKDVKAADDFADALKELEWQGKVLAGKFTAQYMPDITNAIQKVEAFFSSHQEGIKNFGAAVSGVIKSLADLVDFIDKHPYITRFALGSATMGASEGVVSSYNAFESIGKYNQQQNRIDPNSPEARMKASKNAYSPFMPPLDDDYAQNLKEKQEEAKTAYRQAISDAQTLSAEAQKTAENNLENLKRVHELNLTETADYANKRKSLAKRIYDAELDSIQKEREAIKTASEAGAEDNAEEKYNKLQTRALEAKQKYEKALQAADDEAQKEKIQRAKNSFAALEAVQKVLDDSKLAEIKRDAEARKTTYAAAEDEIFKIQTASAFRRAEELHKEFDLAKGNLAEQYKLSQEMRKTQAEYQAAVEEHSAEHLNALRKDFEYEISQKEAQNRHKDAQDRAELSSFQEAVAMRQKTQVEGINKEIQIGLDGYKRRREILEAEKKQYAEVPAELEKVNAEMQDLVDEQAAFVADAERRKREAIQQSIEDLKQLREEVRQSKAELEDFRADQTRKYLENSVDGSTGSQKLAALQELKNFEAQDAERRNEQRYKDMEAEQGAAFERIRAAENEQEQKAAIIEAYKNKALESEEQFQADIKAIRDRYDTQIEREQAIGQGGFFGIIADGIAGYLQNVALIEDANGKLHFSFEQVFKSIGEMGLQAFGQLASGFGQMVSAWVLGTSQGEHSMRKLFASVLAQVAQTATTYAIMCLAAAALASTGFGAILLGGTPGQFLAAAALFGAVAVGAAVTGRLVAGNSFSQKTGAIQSAVNSSAANSTASGSGSPGGYYSNNSNGNTANITEMNRNTAPVQTIRHEINLTDSYGRRKEFVLQVVKDDFSAYGGVRELIKEMIEG